MIEEAIKSEMEKRIQGSNKYGREKTIDGLIEQYLVASDRSSVRAAGKLENSLKCVFAI